MSTFLGLSDNLALFSNEDKAVTIDITMNMVIDVDATHTLANSKSWDSSAALPEHLVDLADAALSYLEPVVASADRMYTIPGGVQAEAKKALNWRHEAKRGGTPVGLNTARILAKGGQIGIEKIRHIAKYFPRHEVDKKGKGWAPGEEHFPSNGRIAWALWGGDAGQRWASTIVERENKKALAASGYSLDINDDSNLDILPGEVYQPDIDSFKMAHELDPSMGPEFMARVRMDDSGIDRLYKIDIDGRVYVWDDCAWDSLGHVDGDVYTYDSALDDPYDLVETTHVMIDPSSAVIISAFLQERPNSPVQLHEIDPEETQLMADGLVDEDFELIDRVMMAAGEPLTAATTPAATAPAATAPATPATDGNYTPEERSKNAQGQPRDASGHFASAGSRVVVGGDARRGSGTITEVDSTSGKVKVRLDSGKSIYVDSKMTTAEKDVNAPQMIQQPVSLPIDTSQILGEPRTPIDQPKAHLSGTLPPLTKDAIHSLINNWDAWVKQQRSGYKLLKDSDIPKRRGYPKSGLNAYDKKFVKTRWGLNDNQITNSIIAAAQEQMQSPDTSDIPAKYLAIVSPDDKTAVMDLVAIVPETTTTTTPALYKRKEGEWVKDDQILLDLKSATPPPVVELDDKTELNNVLTATDQALAASAYNFSVFWDTVVDPLLAAGGHDRNRGNAEILREYWAHGKGAAKIRWGTPGDWKRCVRYLSKHLGERAKGYCQLRHKEATGMYTATHAKMDRKHG